MKRNLITKKIISLVLVLALTIPYSMTAIAASPVDKAVSWAVSTAGNSKYGYDQNNRWGPNYDCSSFLITAYQNAGVKVKTNGATNTRDMRNAFLKSGFTDITKSINLKTGSGLKKGDVLLTPGSHTVMVSSVSGSKITIVHASINEKGTATGGKTGDQTGKEICTRSYYNKPWTYVLRYSGSSSSTSYYPKYTGSSASLVTALQKVGVNSSYSFRAKIAAANGISNYSGTATQNTKLLNLLKNGKLKKV